MIERYGVSFGQRDQNKPSYRAVSSPRSDCRETSLSKTPHRDQAVWVIRRKQRNGTFVEPDELYSFASPGRPDEQEDDLEEVGRHWTRITGPEETYFLLFSKASMQDPIRCSVKSFPSLQPY